MTILGKEHSAMRVHRYRDKPDVGAAAAADAARYLREVIRDRGEARIVLATGVSQLDLLDHLTQRSGLDWSRVTAFHLDEYIGLPPDHPASFRRYLQERFADKVHPRAMVLIDGRAEPEAECRRLAGLIEAAPIDATFVGMGENGHLAFNDPPADFETEDPFIVVRLDQPSRRQQVGEGWFRTVEDVPDRAISMSIRQIMQARRIFAVVPEARKAEAVRACLEEEVSPWRPASILQRHPNVDLYLDSASSALLAKHRSSLSSAPPERSRREEM
jgi:glucosamine-6-phosphate deaminase